MAVLCALAAFLPGLHSAALAHVTGDDAQPMRFVRYDRDDGLSQSAVNQILQDPTGFMWFATESGLNRFDGYGFTTYRQVRGNPNTLPNDFITDLAFDRSGDLWIATDGGGVVRRHSGRHGLSIYRHDPDESSSLPDDHVRKILADPDGWVWAGTMRHGLSRIDPVSGATIQYRHEPGNPASLSDDRIYALWLDADGGLWIGTGAGLDRLDTSSGLVTRYSLGRTAGNGGSDHRVLAIRRDSRGDLWIGTARHGLARLDAASGDFHTFRHNESDEHALGGDRVEVIYEDSAGRLWIGTNNGLHLANRERGSFARYRHDPADPSSLSDSYVISIFEDRGGVLWVGTKTGGISKWNKRSWLFGHVRPEADGEGAAGSPKITAFAEDLDGRLWVGTFGSGIEVLDADLDPIKHLRRDGDSALSDDLVMALLTDAEGYVWAGTMHGGLNRIDPVTDEVRVYEHDPDDPRSIAANGIMSLYAARDGTIWIGTFGGGVSRFDRDSDSFVNYGHDPAVAGSLSNPNATAIIEDASGSIWVATSGGGLSRLNASGDGWTHFVHDPDDADSLSGNAVYSLHVDAEGNLWAGTRSGLNRYNGSNGTQDAGTFTSITQSEGLANETIYGIRSDAQGRLWLSTNYGIARYNPASGEIRNFHVSDGLQGEEFNFGAHFKGRNGVLYFGGNNGFNAFDPAALEFRSAPPKVVLTGFSKFNESTLTSVPYEFVKDIDLAYTDDMVTFEFAALDFTAPTRNRYAYMLEGFDRGWVLAGNARRATYTDLSGGKYVFHVKAANSDGAWSKSGLAVSVGVDHPPWLTPWAFAFYAFVVLGSTYLLYRAQAQKLAREAEYSRRLESEVRDRTRDLARSNSELQDANEKLREASMTDALTGLRNRRYLFEEILKDVELVRRNHDPRQEQQDEHTNRDMVFVMVDLDNFKPINDSSGHLAGDRVLLQVRDILRSVCRASDIVVRWGGDEFLIVGREATHEEASMLVERLRARIARTVFAIGNGQVARTTCSIGFASFPFIEEAPDLLNWEQVLGIADRAMYVAKEERDAWVGIHGRSWNGSGDDLYHKLQTDPQTVVEAGHVRLEQSLSLSQSKTA